MEIPLLTFNQFLHLEEFVRSQHQGDLERTKGVYNLLFLVVLVFGDVDVLSTMGQIVSWRLFVYL